MCAQRHHPAWDLLYGLTIGMNSLSKLCLITGEYMSYYLVQQSFTQYVICECIECVWEWWMGPHPNSSIHVVDHVWWLDYVEWQLNVPSEKIPGSQQSGIPSAIDDLLIYPTFQWRSHDVVARRSLSLAESPSFPHRRVASFLIRWTKSSYCTSSWSQKAWSEIPELNYPLVI